MGSSLVNRQGAHAAHAQTHAKQGHEFCAPAPASRAHARCSPPAARAGPAAWRWRSPACGRSPAAPCGTAAARLGASTTFTHLLSSTQQRPSLHAMTGPACAVWGSVGHAQQICRPAAVLSADMHAASGEKVQWTWASLSEPPRGRQGRGAHAAVAREGLQHVHVAGARRLHAHRSG